MELRQLRTFVAVAGAGTVTDAANVLNLAPSSVSEQIRALERSLEARLFDRAANGMRLTDAGGRLLPWATRLLEQAERARREVSRRSEPIRLGALETLAGTHVPAVLGRLARQHPDVELRVVPSASRQDLLGRVETGDLDACLLLDTGAELGDLGFPVPDHGLEFIDVEPVRLVLVAAPGHPLNDGAPVDGDRLGRHRLLATSPGCSFWMAADRAFGPGTDRTALGSIAVVKAWAAQGLGPALLPEFAVVGELGDATLAALPVITPLAELSVRLVWKAGRDAEPELKNVLYAACGGPGSRPFVRPDKGTA